MPREGQPNPESSINPEAQKTPEGRAETIMDQAGEDRFRLFQDVFVSYGSGDGSKLMKKLPHLIIGYGDIMMAYKAITGEEDGKQISRGQRFAYGAAVATEIMFLALAYEKQYETAGAVKFISEGLTKADILTTGLKSIAGKNPKLASIFEKTNAWVKDRIDQLPKLAEMRNIVLAKTGLEGPATDE